MDAISFVILNFIEHELIDELPMSAQSQVCMLTKQSGLLVGEMRLWMYEGATRDGAYSAMSVP